MLLLALAMGSQLWSCVLGLGEKSNRIKSAYLNTEIFLLGLYVKLLLIDQQKDAWGHLSGAAKNKIAKV